MITTLGQMKLSAAAEAAVREKLPAGVGLEQVRVLSARGSITPLADVPETAQAKVAHADAALAAAGKDPRVFEGEPVKFLVTAWMVHEGMNDNRMFFVREELPAALAKIRPPNVLPMDWNHSAVLGGLMDQKVIGVWLSADYAFNPRARDGQGAYGALAQGVMWAWVNPDIAREMLAQQDEDGAIAFSMAAIPTSVEVLRDELGRSYEVLHNPVFMTLSALGVPPGDADCLGVSVVTNDATTLEEQRTALLEDAAQTVATVTLAAATPSDAPALLTEDEMDELQKELELVKAQLTAQTEQLEAMQRAESELAEVRAAMAELEAKLTERETALDAMKSQAEALGQELETTRGEFAVAQARLTEIDAQAAETARETALAARKAELPEAYVAAHNKRSDEERARVEARWRAATDEQWAEIKADLAPLAELKLSYLERSKEEGGLLPTGTLADDFAAAVARLKA